MSKTYTSKTKFEIVLESIKKKAKEQQKIIIQLRDIEQYDFDEICEMVDMKPTAVRVALSRARKTIREALIKRLEEKLNIEPVPGSNVITISLNDKNPEWLARILNAVTDSYIDHHLSVFSSPGPTDVFRRHFERLEKELQPRRQKLEDYKRNKNLSAVDDSIHSLVQTRSELILKLSGLNREKAELETRFTDGHRKIQLLLDQIRDDEVFLRATKKELQELEQHKAKIKDMEMEISSLERTYLEYQKRFEDARINELANTENVNIRVIEYASAPKRPSHSRIFYIALAMVGGMILSIAISLIKEYFDHRVSDADIIESLTGIAVLGIIEKV